MGVIIEDNQEFRASYVGLVENMPLLKTSRKAFNILVTVKDPNIVIRLKDRMVQGRIKEPDFADAVSIETIDGENLVIVDEPDFPEQ